jgi:hypothetical protein
MSKKKKKKRPRSRLLPSFSLVQSHRSSEVYVYIFLRLSPTKKKPHTKTHTGHWHWHTTEICKVTVFFFILYRKEKKKGGKLFGGRRERAVHKRGEGEEEVLQSSRKGQNRGSRSSSIGKNWKKRREQRARVDDEQHAIKKKTRHLGAGGFLRQREHRGEGGEEKNRTKTPESPLRSEKRQQEARKCSWGYSPGSKCSSAVYADDGIGIGPEVDTP